MTISIPSGGTTGPQGDPSELKKLTEFQTGVVKLANQDFIDGDVTPNPKNETMPFQRSTSSLKGRMVTWTKGAKSKTSEFTQSLNIFTENVRNVIKDPSLSTREFVRAA